MAWRHLDAAQQSQPWTITLAPGAQIAGRVTDRQGRPIRNAEVNVSSFAALDSGWHAGFADPATLDLLKSRLAAAGQDRRRRQGHHHGPSARRTSERDCGARRIPRRLPPRGDDSPTAAGYRDALVYARQRNAGVEQGLFHGLCRSARAAVAAAGGPGFCRRHQDADRPREGRGLLALRRAPRGRIDDRRAGTLHFQRGILCRSIAFSRARRKAAGIWGGCCLSTCPRGRGRSRSMSNCRGAGFSRARWSTMPAKGSRGSPPGSTRDWTSTPPPWAGRSRERKDRQRRPLPPGRPARQGLGRNLRPGAQATISPGQATMAQGKEEEMDPESS